MNYLGNYRVITSPYSNHITAEDYAGDHLSNISIYGKGRVVRVINKFESHEDSINYNDFLINKDKWLINNIYHCISITGKEVLMNSDELGGNQIFIETYDNGKLITMRLAHLDSVNVSVGDIVDVNTNLGKQGNTGLVLSNKAKSDASYGSHVHMEIRDSNGNYINPRDYACGNIKTSFLEQSNDINNDRLQIKIIVDNIHIRSESNEFSKILGNVYINEIYDVIEIIDSTLYTWYKIITNLNVIGYVASKKNSNWVSILEPSSKKNDRNNNLILLYSCQADDIHYLKLYNGEKLYIEKN